MALNYCWNHLNLERVGLVVFRHNAPAIAAYSACGFKKQGVLKRFLCVDGAGSIWFDGGVSARAQTCARHQFQAGWRNL